jgi:hypothetical protein
LLDIVKSHWGHGGTLAHDRRRGAGDSKNGPIVVEGMGRVFARKFGVGGEMPDFELSWLRHMQHELRPVEARAGARPCFSSLTVAAHEARGPER